MTCLSSCFMKAIRDLHNMDQGSQVTKQLDRFLRRAGAKANGQIAQVSGSRKKVVQATHRADAE